MKKPPEQLAIQGGKAVFEQSLHVGRPNIGNREHFLARINEMFDRRWFTNNGLLVQEFEKRIAEFVGVKHCIAVCNATIGLELTIRAAGLKGEVIVPSYTFIATAHALQWQEITPVFCDLDPATHNIDPARVEQLITPKTTGIIGVHVWGRPCKIEALVKIAERRKLTLMFDAAHAFGCSHNGKMIGGFGLAEVFSFHATKFINSFEGGAIATDNDDLAARIRLMKNFGFAGYDNVIHIGTNGKMTEVCAAMGLSSLDAVDEIVAVNRRNYECYQEGLRGFPGIRLLEYDPKEHNNYQYIVLEIDPAKAPLNRDEIVAVLHAENVLARKYFWPGCHRMEPYASRQPNAQVVLLETERVAASVILLPTGTAVSEADIALVCGILRAAVAQAKQVRAVLAVKPGT